MMIIRQLFLWMALLLLPMTVLGFLPPSTTTLMQKQHPHSMPRTTTTNSFADRGGARQQSRQQIQKPQQQRRGSVQMQGLFGLGFAEIAIILVAVGFVLGPQTIGKLARSSADQASALKDELGRVPEEFQKGLEEGESNVRSRKAKKIKVLKDDDE